MPRHTGGDPEPCKPVHEPTTDSRSGEVKTGAGAQLAPPRHRSGLDEGGLPADAQGWRPWHRRRDGGGLRSEPRGESVGPPGPHSVGPLSRTAGAPGLHPESGRYATAAGHPDLRRQGAQRAVAMVLEAIYEQDFLPCSYGFRPGRSAHQALDALRAACMGSGVRWCIDVDIKSYFETIDHGHLRDFLDQRVTDGVIRRMIDKWLKAGAASFGARLRHSGGLCRLTHRNGRSAAHPRPAPPITRCSAGALAPP